LRLQFSPVDVEVFTAIEGIDQFDFRITRYVYFTCIVIGPYTYNPIEEACLLSFQK